MGPTMLLAAALAASGLAEGTARSADVSATGSVSARVEYSEAKPESPLYSFAATAPFRSLLEAALRLKIIESSRTDLSADLSLYASNYLGNANAVTAPLRDNRFVIHELIQNVSAAEHLVLTAGRKRIVWGTGFVANPTDLLNAGKDPLDPSSQRTGSWLALAEAPFAAGAASAFFAPQVLRTAAGLPLRILDGPDRQRHWTAGGRLYALVRETDLTAMWFHTERAGDPLRRGHLGFSASRFVLPDLEWHAEALAHRGSTRSVVEEACVHDSATRLLACAAPGAPELFRQPHLHARRTFVRGVAGLRYAFRSGAQLVAEYLHDGEGLDRREWDDRAALYRRVRDVLAEGLVPSAEAAAASLPLFPSTGGDSAPARFGLGTLRRHYAFLSLVAPGLRDDFTLTATLVAGLEDGSGAAAVSLAWAAREAVHLTASTFVPFGATRTEFGDSPQRARAALEARAYY